MSTARARPGRAARIAKAHRRAYLGRMIRFFDMDDRARLPWRFYGQARSVLARL
jgi:hypothetical protein